VHSDVLNPSEKYDDGYIVVGMVTKSLSIPKLKLWQIVPFATLGILVALTFLSMMVVPFAKWDDYPFSLVAKSDPTGFISDQSANGRVLDGVILYLTMPRVEGVQDYYLIRGLAVAGLIVLSWILYREFSTFETTKGSAFWLAYAICVMPAFAYFATSANSYAYPASAALGVGAGWAAKRFIQSSNLGQGLLFAGLGVLLIGLAGLIFEATAMMFWVPAVVYLFGRMVDTKTLFRNLIYYGLVFGAGCLLIFIVHAALGANSHAHSAIATDFVGKVEWFFGKPITDAFSLFVMLIPSSQVLAVCVEIFIIVGLWFFFGGSAGERVMRLAIALAILPAAFLPQLIAENSWTMYRTQVALTSVIVVYLFFALVGYSRLIGPQLAVAVPMVFTLFALTAGLVAARNVTVNTAFPNLFEFGYLKSQLRQADLEHVSNIYILRPDWIDGPAPEKVEEFGIMTSHWDWGAIPITKAALQAIGQDDSRFIIKSFDPGVKVDPAPGTLVIDMVKIDDFR